MLWPALLTEIAPQSRRRHTISLSKINDGVSYPVPSSKCRRAALQWSVLTAACHEERTERDP
ncbi:hypothetical protein BaRGS_00012520, partial [Batillaria attramentaria]